VPSKTNEDTQHTCGLHESRMSEMSLAAPLSTYTLVIYLLVHVISLVPGLFFTKYEKKRFRFVLCGLLEHTGQGRCF